MSLPSLHLHSSLVSLTSPNLNSSRAAAGRSRRNLGAVGSLFLGVALLFAPGASRADELNACGCSQSSTGECVCTKQAKCGCPGMCEPVGCAAKREKEWKRELDAETRRAAAGAGAPARGRDQELKRASATESSEGAVEKAGPAKAPKVPQLSASQERSLRKLLDAYLEAHPEAQNRSLGEVRAALSSSTGG